MENQVKCGDLRRPFCIRLRPNPELLRSSEFLHDVARVSKLFDVAVELEGSPLSHSYYILRRAGAKVACVDLFNETTKSQHFGKLVRDKIPLRIERHGEKPVTLRVSSNELLDLLKAKAVEEALELYSETEEPKLMEELADILEVVESVAKAVGKEIKDVKTLAEKKKAERGGFADGVVLLETFSVPLIKKQDRDPLLFSEPEDGTGSVTSSRLVDSRAPKLVGQTIELSLVPPPENSFDSLRIQLGENEYWLSVTYSHAKILAKLSPVAPKSDPNQTFLPFPDSGD